MTASEIVWSAGPARLSPPWDRRRVLLWAIAASFLIGAVWGMQRVDMSITALIDGWPETRNLLERMWPPKLAAEDRTVLIRAVLDTFFMAVLGTAIAVGLSLPLGFLAAGSVVRNPVIRGTARGIIALARAVPELILALIFVRVFSIGVLPGVLALGLHSIGFCGKLFADAAENVEVGQREGVAATGASRGQELVTGVWSQMVPSVIATSLYRLEINFRAATLLGLVGAGGIGLQIKAYQGNLRYPELLGVTLLIIVMVIAIELFSSAARRSILGTADPLGARRGFRLSSVFGAMLRRHGRSVDPIVGVDSTAGEPSSRGPGRAGDVPLTRPWTWERVKLSLFGSGAVAVVLLGFVVPDLSVRRFFASVWEVPATFLRMVPRDLSFWSERVRADLLETIAIGLAATAIALVFAVPVAFLAAGNVSPNRWVHRITRVMMVITRATPELVIAVIFVAALGLGPRTGTLALSVGMFGFATRLFADTIEEARAGPREGVVATGATRLQDTSSAVVPQVLPALIGQALYVFDVSLRSSTVLGIVGGGGIGFLISNGMRTLNFEFVGGLVLCIFLIVYAIELLTNWVRKQIL
ncbi:MAG: phosphonate ABC transporter, permease protein PhnE [Ilumatobacter sp.]